MQPQGILESPDKWEMSKTDFDWQEKNREESYTIYKENRLEKNMKVEKHQKDPQRIH